ncbi:hypothetical protein BESB_070890 [Besnoitia besnoiti]|uniref:AAA+ ATPase domain-containing protein n=1 Tax=Besnoitia besnoiti TaxID=94643 RepID=A0A2A9ME83_BESBE|nr:uncharacterized protein BESB_070890 [Besnoitia besnoiti]PFH33937.1 hypothetical protein BESB_070890 [Besnoitia besnoiti]
MVPAASVKEPRAHSSLLDEEYTVHDDPIHRRGRQYMSHNTGDRVGLASVSSFLRTAQGRLALRRAVVDTLIHQTGGQEAASISPSVCRQGQFANKEAQHCCPFALWDGLVLPVSLTLPFSEDECESERVCADTVEQCSRRYEGNTSNEHRSSRIVNTATRRCRFESERRCRRGAPESKSDQATSRGVLPRKCRLLKREEDDDRGTAIQDLDTALAARLHDGLEDLYSASGDQMRAECSGDGTSHTLVRTALPHTTGNPTGKTNSSAIVEESCGNKLQSAYTRLCRVGRADSAPREFSICAPVAQVVVDEIENLYPVGIEGTIDDILEDRSLEIPEHDDSPGTRVGAHPRQERTCRHDRQHGERITQYAEEHASAAACGFAVHIDVIVSFPRVLVSSKDSNGPSRRQSNNVTSVRESGVVDGDINVDLAGNNIFRFCSPSCLPPALTEAWTNAWHPRLKLLCDSGVAARYCGNGRDYESLAPPQHSIISSVRGEMPSMPSSAPLPKGVAAQDGTGYENPGPSFVLCDSEMLRKLQSREELLYVADPVDVYIASSAPEAAALAWDLAHTTGNSELSARKQARVDERPGPATVSDRGVSSLQPHFTTCTNNRKESTRTDTTVLRAINKKEYSCMLIKLDAPTRSARFMGPADPVVHHFAVRWACFWRRQRAYLDALCGAPNPDPLAGHSMMSARSLQLSEFLADLLPTLAADAFINHRAHTRCKALAPQPIEELGSMQSNPFPSRTDAYPLPGLVVVATALRPTTLHQSLRTPTLFGGEAVQLKNPQTSRERADVIQHLLRRLVPRAQRYHAPRRAKERVGLMMGAHGSSKRGTALERPWDMLSRNRFSCRMPLQIHEEVWEHVTTLSQKTEGFGIADFKALIEQAAAEARYGLNPESDWHVSHSGASPPSGVRHRDLLTVQVQQPPYRRGGAASHGVVLCRAHFDHALREFVPRALHSHDFLKANLTLRDVGGLEKVKEDLRDMLTMESRFGHLMRRAGVSVHRGVLLIGPPGCGKSLLAKAAVGDLEMRCLEVKGPELLNKYIGSSEAAVRGVFNKAQQAKPCVVLFDEIDSLAPKRGGDSTGVTDRVVNQLLCYLDGVEERQGVYVIATTSRPDLLDPALLRPGRLEKVCYCGLPTSSNQRLQILEACAKKTGTANDVSLPDAEKAIPWDFAPADIHAAVKSAQLMAVHERLDIASRPPPSVCTSRVPLTVSPSRPQSLDAASECGNKMPCEGDEELCSAAQMQRKPSGMRARSLSHQCRMICHREDTEEEGNRERVSYAPRRRRSSGVISMSAGGGSLGVLHPEGKIEDTCSAGESSGKNSENVDSPSSTSLTPTGPCRVSEAATAWRTAFGRGEVILSARKASGGAAEQSAEGGLVEAAVYLSAVGDTQQNTSTKQRTRRRRRHRTGSPRVALA